jgi:anti-sigma regulatory factor (Ser/Thr protein kinase)
MLSVEDRPLGGLGIHLIRQLTDNQSYSHSALGGNRLSLVKRLPYLQIVPFENKK